MAEFWIVTSVLYKEHTSLEAAVAEMRARQSEDPGTRFHVIRCKRHTRSARHFTKLCDLLRDILHDGLTKAHRERAQVLLSTIATRSRA